MAAKSTFRPLAKTAAAGCFLGVTIWGAGDVLGEYTTYTALRDRALKLANENEDLKQQIGHPFSLGPWYNASIGFTAGGNIAQSTFQLVGSRQITDVTVRGIRGPGYRNRALYNIFDSGHWTIIECNAMFPAGGGLVKSKSILPDDNSKAKKAAEGDAAAAPEGTAAHVVHGAQPAPADAQSGSTDAGAQQGKKSWRWWPKRKQADDQQQQQQAAEPQPEQPAQQAVQQPPAQQQ